ncbi:hypothetical protein N0070_19810 [Pseudomonas aeruginosa]|nr:hypothetical protein [Pseudomonas aeruginosa]MCS7618447.1 hypothetical protein [Pseudomonas aeruginosa]MCS9911564.1 hypothetical protein [Pseudomonas aeruginosa]
MSMEMNKANECTCPSGDGSLRWPCPKHPAVDQADVAAKLTFINGRPAMCGCQVEYSDGGGEYSDVIYVTLCAKHSGSAILDLVATNRIALTPEYEGQWHADLYLDREIPLAKVEGATPAEAVLALMSAERIDPEQESVEQAGGDERAAFKTAYLAEFDCDADGDDNMAHSNTAWRAWKMARTALAQPSPAPVCTTPTGENCPGDGVKSCKKCPEQAEAERPGVVARVVHSNPVVLGQCGPLNANDELMTVAQHAASVARWAEMFNRVEQQRDAALARVAELERQEPVAWGAFHFGGERDGKLYTHCETEAQIEAYILDMHRSSDSLTLRKSPLYAAPVAQAQHSAPIAPELKRALGLVVAALEADGDRPTSKYALSELKKVLAAAPGNSAQHSVPEWTSSKPAVEGAYWVRGNGLVEPFVVLVKLDQGELWCNLHMRNTDTNFGYGYAVDDLSSEFEWCGPLAAATVKEVPQAWLDVQAERRRQIEAEGWTPENDDAHSHGQMARAAACYALAGSSAPNDGTAALLVSLAWPWDEQWWKPSTARRDLIKAGALILAEIERLDRAAPGKEGV